MGLGISESGGDGGLDHYKSFNYTTSGTADTDLSHDTGQLNAKAIIVNDGSVAIELGFQNDTGNANKSFTLNAGEVLTIPLVFRLLHSKSTGTSVPFRVLVIY